MKRLGTIIFLLVMLTAFSGTLSAQTVYDKERLNGPITIEGRPIDKFTEQDILTSVLSVYEETDTVPVYSNKTYSSYNSDGRKVETSMFMLYGLKKDKKYRIELEAPGYEIYSVIFDPSTLNKTSYHKLGNIVMTRKGKDLDEINVTASKVKFYNRGDTIVYNADAFILAEGTMLDGLIRQLPGVELKSDGRIFVNGKFVESLLLNGKDFFKGNNKLMLENLGAYTVKQIEVFERQDEKDKFIDPLYGEKKLTMDVKLKKEYNHGMLLNAEAGYGTHDRYLGRLFGLWFSDHASIGAFGNVNNLNDERTPGQESSFKPENMPVGTKKTITGGINYEADSRQQGWRVNGDVVFKRNSLLNDQQVNTVNFLATGDTYGYSFSKSRNRNRSLSTSHNFTLNKPGKIYLSVSPSFKYNNADRYTDLASAVFSGALPDVDKTMIENIFSGAYSSAVSRILNRNLNFNDLNGNDISADINAYASVKLRNPDYSLFFSAYSSYQRSKETLNERYEINFDSSSQPADKADRTIHNYPAHTFKANGTAGFSTRPVTDMSLGISYSLQHQDSKYTSDLFNLAETVSREAQTGMLPSMTQRAMTLDPSLSYFSHRSDDSHVIAPSLYWQIMEKRMYVRLEPKFIIDCQKLDYLRGDIDAHITRVHFRPSFSGEVTKTFSISEKKNLSLILLYNLNSSTPDLVNMVSMTDTRNPLYITEGNSDLKNQLVHNPGVMVMIHGGKGRQSFELKSNIYRNMFAAGYSYDTRTGVRTSRIYNVNGNMDIRLVHDLWMPFGKNNKFSWSNKINLSYARSVDYMGENDSELSLRKVNNFGVGENLTIDYKIYSNSKIGLKFDGNWHRYTSGMANFTAFDAWDLKYGPTAVFKLPANFQISTDLMIYTRRGYSDSRLNTDNFVWNARVSYSLSKPKLNFMLDGFDILHNLSNVSYVVNAQSRTETYRNVLPSYFLFHIQWSFNVQPKNKQK